MCVVMCELRCVAIGNEVCKLLLLARYLDTFERQDKNMNSCKGFLLHTSLKGFNLFAFIKSQFEVITVKKYCEMC